MVAVWDNKFANDDDYNEGKIIKNQKSIKAKNFKAIIALFNLNKD